MRALAHPANARTTRVAVGHLDSMVDGASSSSAAFAVGYESVPQFTREYGRMFGLPPVKDIKAVRNWAEAAE